MRRAVLLLHQTSDGAAHFDWLIERHEGQDPNERALLAFRVASRIDQRSEARFKATRIADHRRRYLTYEGTIAGERGEVARVASGHAVALHEGAGVMSVQIDWGHSVIEYEGRFIHDDAWRFNAKRAGGR